MEVEIVVLPHFEGLSLPQYETDGSVGMDLRCAETETLCLPPMARKAVATGLKMAIPEGFEAQVRPRSGLAVKLGLGVINSPGTIDSDYRGELKVPLINLSQTELTITRGMRIAQLVISPVQRVVWRPVGKLDATVRAEGGFGHTGSD